MTKQENADNPESCWNKAADGETLFILRGKDPAFAETVRFWASERVRLGLNGWFDDKVRSAVRLAEDHTPPRKGGAK